MIEAAQAEFHQKLVQSKKHTETSYKIDKV
jgi:hypothetical protein